MKIIHTSDWHIGQNLYNLDRKEEHDSMVEQLSELVRNEKPDALVIAGDIYDVSVPNTTAQKSLAEYLVKVHDAHPSMVIVCISGNHDSASRHEIFQTPWEALGVKMIGKIDSEDFAPNVIYMPGKGVIVAVPYTNERFLNDEFYTSLEQYVKENVGSEGLPIVYVGHAAIKECNYEGHRVVEEKYIGGIECTDINELGSLYDYVALGHIHKAQTFNGGRARYSGTPVPVSFDEVREGYEHSFSVVEIDSHGAVPAIRTVEVIPVKELVNIPAEGAAKWDDVMGELKDFSAERKAYLRLNVLIGQGESIPYNREELIKSALLGKKAVWVELNSVREEIKAETTENAGATLRLNIDELQKIDPIEIMKAYAGVNFKDEYSNMLNEILQKLEDEDNEN